MSIFIPIPILIVLGVLAFLWIVGSVWAYWKVDKEFDGINRFIFGDHK